MKILGILDIAAAVFLVSAAYNITIPTGLIIGISVYLLLKAILFLADVGSFFDIIGGVLLILNLFLIIPSPLLFIFAALIGLKGILSLFSFSG